MERKLLLYIAAVMVAVCAMAGGTAWGQEVKDESGPPVQLGDEYSAYNKTRKDAGKGGTESDSFLLKAVLYLPNRVLDLLDIFRLDVGIGPSTGGVVRVTKWGQAGLRFFAPASLRVGLRGRRSPVFLERTSELGVGPLFAGSPQRKTTPLEVGAGIDLFLIGAYAGISLDSAGDFVAGLLGFDPAEDDLR